MNIRACVDHPRRRTARATGRGHVIARAATPTLSTLPTIPQTARKGRLNFLYSAAEVMVRGSSYTVTVKATSLSGRTLVP